MKKWKVCMGLAVLFAAGFLSGVTATRWVVRRRVDQLATWNPETTRRVILARLTRELKLSPRQQGELGPHIEELQREMLHARSRIQPEVHRIVIENARKMAPYLTPDQQAGLRRFFLQQRTHWTDAEAPSASTATGQVHKR